MADEYDLGIARDFLCIVNRHEEQTWEFHIYATYTNNLSSLSAPKGEAEASSSTQPGQNPEMGASKRDAETIVETEVFPDARFARILDKIQGYATACVRYTKPEPYNGEIISKLRLKPVAHLPGATLTQVAAHFWENISDPPSTLPISDRVGSKYDWFIVIDDESAASIEEGQQPLKDIAQPRRYFSLAISEKKIHVKVVNSAYFKDPEPRELAAMGRCGNGPRIMWEGWLKASPRSLMNLYWALEDGDIVAQITTLDKIYDL